MSFFKRTFIISVLSISMFVPLISSAQTDNSALIAQLLAQIKALSAQLQQLRQQQSNNERCHTFNTNLAFENAGSEMSYLTQILEDEGFPIAEKGNIVFFGESTASAVTGFQEKYRDEILTPNGLKYGTGYVGPATRKKLNQLYGCSGQSITGPDKLSVIYVSGINSVYSPGQTINLVVKGTESIDGGPGTPEEGYNVQVYWRLADVSAKSGQGVNATYNSQTQYWNAQFTAPTDSSKTYIVEAVFYCSNASLVCGQRLPSGPTEYKGQVSTSFKFVL